MKKFKFRFETLLEIRAIELEKAELKVAEAQAEVFRAKDFLERIKAETEDRKINLEKLISSGAKLDITWVSSSHHYINYLKGKIFEQKKVIAEKEKILNDTRKEMLLVRQKKMMLDKLKEKDFREYKREFEKNDLMQIDEIATSRHNRK